MGARNITEAERNENAAQQRVLSGMSNEVKAKRRQLQALDSEVDDIHMRRLKADSEVLNLRRQKMSLERQMGNTGMVLPAQQSAANLSEELMLAQDTLEALKIELAHSRQ